MTDPYVGAVKKWITEFVVHYQLCPFAPRVMASTGAVRYLTTLAEAEDQLLRALAEELNFLEANQDVETSFLIHPNVLGDFLEFNQFLDACDELLQARDDIGVYQIASFHPYYQFANTQLSDPENFANRSPFPMLHILRETSVARAVAEHADVNSIPERNIEVLTEAGSDALRVEWLRCFEV